MNACADMGLSLEEFIGSALTAMKENCNGDWSINEIAA